MANTDNYWQHYSMKLDPFSDETDLEPCYLSLQWQQYIDFLSDLNNYRNALVLLTGLPGVGKTCFVYELIAHIPKDVVDFIFHARDCYGAEQLLEMLETKFGIPSQADFNLNLYDKANQQLTYLQHTGKRYLLLIDHAEALPLDVRQVLLHFVQQQLSSDVALQIILVGEEKLVDEMQQIGKTSLSESNQKLSATIVNNLVLDPFNCEETAAYIQHRLFSAGFSGREALFTQDDINYIYQQSNGVAKLINELASSILRGYIMENNNQQEEVKPSILKRYIWWIGVIAVIAILLIWVLPMFQNNNNNNPQPISLPVQQATPQDDAQNQSADQPDAQQSSQQTPTADQQTASQTNSNPDDSQQTNNHYQNLSNAAQNPQQQPAAQQTAQPVSQQTASQQMATQPATQTVQPDEPVVQPTSTPVVKKAAKHNVKKASIKSTQLHTKAGGALTATEGELLKINPNYYTLQLLGSHKKSDIIAFMRQHKLQNEAVYFHTYFNGQDWYVLISGDYPTLAQAKAARAKLPASLRVLNPWIRNFASVHKSIKMRS